MYPRLHPDGVIHHLRDLRVQADDEIHRAFAVAWHGFKESPQEVTRWFGTNTDITDLREAEDAREALLAADPGSTTVTHEALEWGFWHFGDFSRAYKACFGEAPSETLRRKVVDPHG